MRVLCFLVLLLLAQNINADCTNIKDIVKIILVINCGLFSFCLILFAGQNVEGDVLLANMYNKTNEAKLALGIGISEFEKHKVRRVSFLICF